MFVRRRRRDRIQMVVDLLSVALDAAPPNKIRTRANINTKCFHELLEELVASGLIEKIENHRDRLGGRRPDKRTPHLYKTTLKGCRLISLVGDAYHLLEGDNK